MYGVKRKRKYAFGGKTGDEKNKKSKAEKAQVKAKKSAEKEAEKAKKKLMRQAKSNMKGVVKPKKTKCVGNKCFFVG